MYFRGGQLKNFGVSKQLCFVRASQLKLNVKLYDYQQSCFKTQVSIIALSNLHLYSIQGFGTL